MKLFYRVIGRLSVTLIIILAIWAGLFYFALMDEVNDEVDDSLEDYSEVIITRHLAGEELPRICLPDSPLLVPLLPQQQATAPSL